MDSITTYPAEAARAIADRLCDMDYNLPGDEAMEIARDFVIDVTIAVDRLRAIETAALGSKTDPKSRNAGTKRRIQWNPQPPP